MCSKRCKHTLRDRIPICAIGRRCNEQSNAQPLTCLLQKEEISLVDCDNCKPKSGNDEYVCVCNGGTEVTGGGETTNPQSSPPSELEVMNSPLTHENGNPHVNLKSGGGSMQYEYDKSTPSSIRHMDEWEAMAVMLATNGRVWAGEDIGFARHFKAALSAVNTKFEEEAANMTGATTF